MRGGGSACLIKMRTGKAPLAESKSCFGSLSGKFPDEPGTTLRMVC